MRLHHRGRARGQDVLELPVYDGSENGEKVYNTLTVIGRAIEPERARADRCRGRRDDARRPQAMAGDGELFRQDAKKARRGEQTPVYSITFEMYENGVSRALMLDYNDFAISGELTSLELRNSAPCRDCRTRVTAHVAGPPSNAIV